MSKMCDNPPENEDQIIAIPQNSIIISDNEEIIIHTSIRYLETCFYCTHKSESFSCYNTENYQLKFMCVDCFIKKTSKFLSHRKWTQRKEFVILGSIIMLMFSSIVLVSYHLLLLFTSSLSPLGFIITLFSSITVIYFSIGLFSGFIQFFKNKSRNKLIIPVYI